MLIALEGFVPLFAMFGLGPLEIAIVGGIALLLFGNRLPSVARSMGKGIVEFKKGLSGQDDEEPQDKNKLDQPATQKTENV